MLRVLIVALYACLHSVLDCDSWSWMEPLQALDLEGGLIEHNCKDTLGSDNFLRAPVHAPNWL